MKEYLLGAMGDAVVDTVKLLPFLFVTYLLMEALERHAGGKAAGWIQKAGWLSPVAGAAVGVMPQCGFSASAASLYSAGLISLGTLLAVFLSTSDEMLPIFISEQVAMPTVVRILLAKALIGAVSGLAVDGILRLHHDRSRSAKHIADLCQDDHCGCGESSSIPLAALTHTLRIGLFIFVITVLLSLAVEGFGEERVAAMLSGNPVSGTFIAGLLGLIPNCAASVTITQLYLDGLLGGGQMMAGLLVGAGVGLLVLVRANQRHPKENLKVILTLYGVGVAWGLAIECLGITF